MTGDEWQIMIPEEITPITVGEEVRITLSNIGYLHYQGINTPNTNGKTWVRVRTSYSDYVLLLVPIDGCPFQYIFADQYHWGNDVSTTFLQLRSNQLLPASTSKARMLFEYYTHNELITGFPADLGFADGE